MGQNYGFWTVSKGVFEGENRVFSERFEQGKGREGYISQNLNIGKNIFYIGQNRWCGNGGYCGEGG